MENIKFNEAGLIPAIVQDINTGKILMQAYMNKESLEKTLQEGIAYYYSRSRKMLWKKGETSGNIQKVKEIYLDCDMDSLILKVEALGPACHTGKESCFYRKIDKELNVIEAEPEGHDGILSKLYSIVSERKANPKNGSYTNYLFDKGLDKILKKVGEETAEVLIAAKNNNQELKYEIADLLFHLSVLMVEKGLTLEEIRDELRLREN